MQQLNPSEISDLIRSKIQNLSLASDVRNQGTERCVIMFLKVNPKVLKASHDG